MKTDAPRGTLRLLPKIQPSGLNPARDVWVYLPSGYERDRTRRYPVLYMHDGQQIWDSPAAAYGGWKIDTSADRLIAEQKIEPLIIVGVLNSQLRTEEYVGYGAYFDAPEGLDVSRKDQFTALAEGYRAFLIDELKVRIDSSYRTLPDREYTAVAGSSFGAGVSLWLALSRSDVFSKVGGLSGGNYGYSDATPSDKNVFQPFPFLIAQLVQKKAAVKVYLDCGGQDLDAIFLPRTQDLGAALVAQGWQEGIDLLTVIDGKAGHNEAEWAKRTPGMLEFLFGTRE